MVPALFALAALSSLPADGASSRLEAQVELVAAHDFLHSDGAASSRATSGEGAARLRIYFPTVRDDDTPIALQPYLQRASSLDLGARFASVGDAHRGTIFFSTEIYQSRFMGGRFSASYQYAQRGSTEQRLFSSLGWFVRLGDLQVSLGVNFGDNTTASIDLRTVLVEHIELRLGAVSDAENVAAYFRGAYYPTRHLGLRAGGSGGGTPGTAGANDESLPAYLRGQSPIAVDAAAHFGCFIGASYWWNPAFGIEGTYAATWIAGDQTSVNDQRIFLTLAARR